MRENIPWLALSASLAPPKRNNSIRATVGRRSIPSDRIQSEYECSNKCAHTHMKRVFSIHYGAVEPFVTRRDIKQGPGLGHLDLMLTLSSMT